MGYKELTHVKIDGQWLQVYMWGYDQFNERNFYTVKAEDDSYVDVYDDQIDELRYNSDEISEVKLKLIRKAYKDEI